MLKPEQVREMREKVDRLHSAHAPHMVRRLLTDRAEIAQELEVVIGSMQRFPGNHIAHEHALTELMEKLK